MAKRGRAVRGLSGVSSGTLKAELNRRERSVRTLVRRREGLLAAADRISAQIDALGGEGRGGATSGRPDVGRKRPRNKMQLVDVLAKVLEGKTMSVAEALAAVQKAGYRSSAANFRIVVNGALLRDKRFKKVARGQYTLKS